MRIPLLALLAGLLVAMPAVHADDAAKEENDPVPEALRMRIDQAVDKGVDALQARQKENGSWVVPADMHPHRMGVQALLTLALLVGGVKPDELCIRNAFRHIATLPMDKTYDVGVLLMALHAKYAGPAATLQGAPDEYGKPTVKEDPCERKMSAADKRLMKKAVAFLVEHQQGGNWRYPGDGTDLSNTQYALLGLHAAARCGAEIPETVWMSALTWLLATQERSGRQVELKINEDQGRYRMVWKERARARGFRYRPENPVTGAMTTAGLACLAICQGELWSSRRFKPALRQRTRRAIRDALAWMQEEFVVETNPGEPSGGWHYYYLYGVERAGILARQRFFGPHDWYPMGALYLLEAQDAGGLWKRHHVLLDTAFAILFLRRSTYRLRRPVITPPVVENR